MWTCPNCHKSFKTPSQYHSCTILKVEDHLAKKPEHIQILLKAILEYCERAPKQELNVVKTGIMVKCGANFLSIYPKSNQVTIEFQIPYFTDEFPIAFSKRISAHRVYCRVKLGSPEEFDHQIKQWIKESYELISGNTFI